MNKRILQSMGFTSKTDLKSNSVNSWRRQPAPFTYERKEGETLVFNLLLVDASGSMSPVRMETLDGLNSNIENIKEIAEKNPEQRHFITIVAFDSDEYRVIVENMEAEKVSEVRKKDYCPNACTPLYDAMGKMISDLRPIVADTDKVVMTVLTDGYENSSREFSSKHIADLVDLLKKQGWLFTYIGANQDVEEVAKDISINAYMSYSSDSEGTTAAFGDLNMARTRHFCKMVHEPGLSIEEQEDDFFAK